MATLHSSKKNQTVFLINNYDLILKVLHEFNIQSEEVIKFSALVYQPLPSPSFYCSLRARAVVRVLFRVHVRWCGGACACGFV